MLALLRRVFVGKMKRGEEGGGNGLVWEILSRELGGVVLYVCYVFFFFFGVGCLLYVIHFLFLFLV